MEFHEASRQEQNEFNKEFLRLWNLKNDHSHGWKNKSTVFEKAAILKLKKKQVRKDKIFISGGAEELLKKRAQAMKERDYDQYLTITKQYRKLKKQEKIANDTNVTQKLE